MAGPKFAVGQTVWHGSNNDNGVKEGFGVIASFRNKQAFNPSLDGFIYRIDTKESATVSPVEWDEHTLQSVQEKEDSLRAEDESRKLAKVENDKKDADAKKAAHEQIKKHEGDGKKAEDAKKLEDQKKLDEAKRAEDQRKLDDAKKVVGS